MWDEPLGLLSVTDGGGRVVSLPLDSLRSCAIHLARLDAGALSLLTRALGDAAEALEMWGGSPPWPPQLRDAIGLLLMFVIAAKATQSHQELVHAAKRVASRLSADAPSGAWYAAFQDHLPFAHRAGVLAAAADRDVVMPILDLVWWTAKCRLDLAIHWAATVRVDDVDALHELVAASSAYIRLLQQERCRRAMERFYEAGGTRSEAEVLRAHEVREDHTNLDELARADVMTWLLGRYAIRETWNLLKGTLTRVEWAGVIAASAFSLMGLVLFLTQSYTRWQVFLQMAGFVSLVLLSPRMFALALPRAMFGTLLAWITVVVAQSASLLPIVGNEPDATSMRKACHTWLWNVMHPEDHLTTLLSDFWGSGPITYFPDVFDFVGIVLVCLSVSTVFLMIEVSNRLSTSVARRAFLCVMVMLTGSLFWGAMLVPTLQYIVARQPHDPSCGCVYPAWLLGSVCAVAFGILVQLLWDDRAVSDSLGAHGVGVR